MKAITISVSVAALLGLAISGCDRPRAAETKKPPAPAKVEKVAKDDAVGTIELTPEADEKVGIETAVVERKSVARTRSYAGDVIVPPGRLITVSAPVIGTVLAPEGGIPTPGTPLKRGRQLFALQPLLSPEARATMLTSHVDAEGQVEQAKKQLEQAEINFKRSQSLRQGIPLVGSAALVDTKNQLDLAKTMLHNAEARRDSLAKIMKEAEAGAASPMSLTAPEDGVLKDVLVQASQQVAAGSVLFIIERVDPVWVRVPVYVGDFEALAADKPATITDLAESPGAPAAAGRPVVEAPPIGDPLVLTVDQFYEVANRTHAFRPGQKVGVRIPLKGEETGLVVPKSALYYDIQGGSWVYEKTKDHTYVRRRVEVDHVVGDAAVVMRGVKAGANVVTVGVAELVGTEFGFSK